MVTLSPSQIADLQQLANVVTEHDPPRPTLLLSPPKSGKRTLARALAEKLALAFLPISLRGAAHDLSGYLFGEESDVDSDEGVGALGRSADTVLYFSDLDVLPRALQGSFYRLIAEGSYRGPRGSICLPRGCVIVAGLNLGSTAGEVTSEHWICSAFPHRLTLQDYRGRKDGRDVVASMLRDLGGSIPVEGDVGDLLASFNGTHWSLGDLRGWIQAVIRARSSNHANEALRAEEIRSALIEDMAVTFASVAYRGAPVARDDLDHWLSQFSPELRVGALHMAREAATTYFFSTERYFSALRRLIADAEIETGETVTFCCLDQLGKSGAHIAHDLKNMSRWRPTDDVDCTRPPGTWPDLDSQNTRHLLIVDDFVGSGQSLSRSLRGPQQAEGYHTSSPLEVLLEKFPKAQILVLVICGLRRGLQRIQRTLEELAGSRAKLVAHVVLDDGDRCFLRESRVFPEPGVRERMRRFLVEAAQECLGGLRSDHRLGHDNAQLLVVFYNTVPNCTLPHIWFDADPSSWHPLFPASETTTALLAESAQSSPKEEGGSWLRRLWRSLLRKSWRTP